MRPIIGITADYHEKRHRVADAYSNAVFSAGGTPLIIPPISGIESHFLTICDGFVFTGGDDPKMEEWGIATHPNATPVSHERQEFELSLISKLQQYQETPVLGICLGMQWMCLLAGGTINQDLHEPFAKNHKNSTHKISGAFGEGSVHSHHHQAMSNAGSLEIIATADDGIIEAVRDSNRLWYVGVQWHPERTENVKLGQELFNQLIQASLRTRATIA